MIIGALSFTTISAVVVSCPFEGGTDGMYTSLPGDSSYSALMLTLYCMLVLSVLLLMPTLYCMLVLSVLFVLYGSGQTVWQVQFYL
jgi:hypothetical protein